MSTLSSLLPDFLYYLQFERRYSQHTLIAYGSDLEQFERYLCSQYGINDASGRPAVQLVDISPFLLKSWLADLRLQKQAEVKTINRKISAVRSFFRFLLRKGTIATNPSTVLKVLKTPRRLPTYLKEEQAAEVLQVTEEASWKAKTGLLMMELLYNTGLRVSELAGLRERHVDLRAASIKVLGKGNKERVIPIRPELLQQVKDYLEEKAGQSDADKEFLLVNTGGRPLNVKYIYREVKERLGPLRQVSKKSPHVMRHTFATHLLNNGAELNAIKELLGHASLAATQVYTHNSIEKLRQVHQKAHPRG